MNFFDERLPKRFWDKCIPEPNSGCWLWTGADTPKGYGSFYLNSKLRRVHRVAYEILVGPIPGGLQLDHLCRVRCCCNPAHLEPVTNRENAIRGDAGRAGGAVMAARFLALTHCRLGHPLDGASGERRSRYCKACNRLGCLERRSRLRAAGLCWQCGSPAAPGVTLCEPHRLRENQRQSARKKRLRAARKTA